MAQSKLDRRLCRIRIFIDIPNEDGTFTTLKGEEAKKWYNKAVEEDKEETEEESSMQSTDNEDEVQARGSFLL